MKRSQLVAIGVVVGIGGVFALAIRGDRRGEVVRGPVEEARERARAQATAVRDEVAAADEQARTEALAHRIAGARPGQPGPLFDAIHFGSAGLSAPVAAFQAISEEATRSGVGVGVEPQRLTVRVPHEVAARILARWGDPAPPIRDAASHTALTIDDEAATTRFTWEPHETLAHLVDPGDDLPPGSTPFSIVGKALGDVSLALGSHLQHGDAAHPDEYVWALPPMDDETVSAEIDVDHGVIAKVTIQLFTPPGDVEHALRTVYGDPPWKHGGVRVEMSGHPPDGATITATRAK